MELTISVQVPPCRERIWQRSAREELNQATFEREDLTQRKAQGRELALRLLCTSVCTVDSHFCSLLLLWRELQGLLVLLNRRLAG